MEEKVEDGRKGVVVTEENWTADAVFKFALRKELVFREGSRHWVYLQLPGETKLSQRSVKALGAQETTFRNALKRRRLDEETQAARLRRKATSEAKP